MKKLTKQMKEEVDAHKRHLEFAVHDTWSAMYRRLLDQHGECPDGMHCLKTPGAIHLKHTPVDSDLIESTFLNSLRAFLALEIIVNHREPPKEIK